MSAASGEGREDSDDRKRKRNDHAEPQEAPSCSNSRRRLSPSIEVSSEHGEVIIRIPLPENTNTIPIREVLNELYDVRLPQDYPNKHWQIRGFEGSMYGELKAGKYEAIEQQAGGPDEAECVGWEQMCGCKRCQLHWLEDYLRD